MCGGEELKRCECEGTENCVCGRRWRGGGRGREEYACMCRGEEMEKCESVWHTDLPGSVIAGTFSLKVSIFLPVAIAVRIQP